LGTNNLKNIKVFHIKGYLSTVRIDRSYDSYMI